MQVQDNIFPRFVEELNRFKVFTKPSSEYELEKALLKYLQARGYSTGNQERSRLGRYDVTVQYAGKNYCIELKRFADRSCVAQIDRYSVAFDGIILLCWQCSQALREIFALAKGTTKKPLALVEVKKNCSIV